MDDTVRERLEALRRATELRRKVHLSYVDAQDVSTERIVRPLGCLFWSTVWTLAAWCETRQDFRRFRLDRNRELDTLDEHFRDEAGKTLADLMRCYQV